MINHKNEEDCKLKKFKYNKYLGKRYKARAHLWRENAQNIWYSISLKERQLFRLNELVFKCIRTTLQTYKVDERTFQTPCIICKGETSLYKHVTFFTRWFKFKPYFFLLRSGMDPPSPLISGVNSFPSRFINRTACFPPKSVIFPWVLYVTVEK